MKPFLKWVGGKTQLIPQLEKHLPPELYEGFVKKYAEPFIGGGAFFFYLAQRFKFESVMISDLNEKLITTYKTIQTEIDPLIENLHIMHKTYLNYSSEQRQEYFYAVRDNFNDTSNKDPIRQAAQLIFLNRTCFNGLYRVNSKGGFNVPFGKYENPCICDETNLREASKLLQPVEILHGDFYRVKNFIDHNTFAYFDPPYRPISKTSNFTAYTGVFNDARQIELASLAKELHEKGAKLLLSNSYQEDNFFQKIYSGFQIEEIVAKRNINRSSAKEILVKNY